MLALLGLISNTIICSPFIVPWTKVSSISRIHFTAVMEHFDWGGQSNRETLPLSLALFIIMKYILKHHWNLIHFIRGMKGLIQNSFHESTLPLHMLWLRLKDITNIMIQCPILTILQKQSSTPFYVFLLLWANRF